MKPLLLKFSCTLTLTILLLTGAKAQSGNFIYIQAEDQKPFYVKMDKKMLNSSATGYMIIPRLSSNLHTLILGSQKKEWPEQQFVVLINADDKGFLLKNNGPVNMVMQDFKNDQLTRSSIIESVEDKYEYIESTDDFAKILASVVDDHTISRIRVDNMEEAADNAHLPVVKEVENSIEQSNTGINVAKSELPIDSKIQSEQDEERLQMSIPNKEIAKADTIKAKVPVVKRVIKPQPAVKSKGTAPVTAQVAKPNTDSRFLDMELQNPNKNQDSANYIGDVVDQTKLTVAEDKIAVTEAPANKAASQLRMINSDCKSIATQSGFVNLRKRMETASNEAGMTIIAIKSFTAACFTTEQIKKLGVLYISEEERYKFYVSAYPYVTDSHNFGTLEDQLTDYYYQSRFKAMVSR